MPQRKPLTGTDGREASPSRVTVPAPAWFALRLLSRRDQRVREDLDAVDIEQFFPTYDELTQWSDRQKLITRPVFPGYAFIRCEPWAFHIVRRISGVVQILGVPEPEQIPDGEIASMRIALASRKPLLACSYVSGQKVLVTQGPLAGTSGVVVRSKGATRIVIAIELLRRAVSVEILAEDLAPHK
jgi:transcription antitermination factor NusG